MDNNGFGYFIAALRPGQWVKNLFVFLPLVFGKKLFSCADGWRVFFAFFLFSLTASAAYLINDVIDLKNDRCHPAKNCRPVASGKISPGVAIAAAALLGIVSLAGSLWVDPRLGCVMLGYLFLSVIYAKVLKKIVIIDVFCLGAFFFLRIAAGGIASGVQLSYWIVSITVLLALFLGFNKRRQELQLLKQQAVFSRTVLSRYDAYFIDQVTTVLTSSIVIVYMLYTVNGRTVREFGTDHLLYGAPFVYYGIFRYLYIVHRKGKGDDPAGALLSDLPLQLDLLFWLLICIGVIYFGL